MAIKTVFITGGASGTYTSTGASGIIIFTYIDGYTVELAGVTITGGVRIGA